MIKLFIIGLWSVISLIAALVTLPGSFELLVISLAAFLPKGVRPFRAYSGSWRVAIVVPAHNEELNVASCVESLLHADQFGMTAKVFVIADNCTDETALVAQKAGATVLERSHATERGKGYALHFAFTHAELTEYDCVLIVDADTVVAPNFIYATASTLRDGADAVQARWLARNLDDSNRSRLVGLALRGFNVVRPLGRENLGLSVGLLGNGFGLRKETVQAVPYLAASVVEDLEYHLSLVRSGRRVTFVNETTVYGEMPVRGKGVETQRSRWEGGRFRMLKDNGPALFMDLLHGKLRCLEPLLDLLLLPLAFHVALLMVVCLSPQWEVRYIGFLGFGAVIIYLMAAIFVGKDRLRDMFALAGVPFYILWKILLIPALVRSAGSDQTWVRTARREEEQP